MRVIFLTLVRITDVEERGIYSDLMRKFRDEGHDVYIVSPCERRLGLETSLAVSKGVHFLNVKTLNVLNTNIIEKGLGTLMLEYQFKEAIKKWLADVKFDLITYSTPPITFTNVVRYLKKKNPQAVSYLQLKDIFPQNAVDIGLFGKKSLLYWYFRKKETSLYQTSDYIGCMSPANVEYLKRHNPDFPPERVEVAPNSLDLKIGDDIEKSAMREKYGLPLDRPILIYGGNLGKPQGIDYIIQCLDDNKDRKDCFFVIVGSGTEYGKLESWFNHQRAGGLAQSVRLMKGLPKKDYDLLVRSCDVGLIFLDHRFTIPNYPSRLLSYLEYKMPVICATDVNSDIGRIAAENGYGYWCESVKPEDFTALVNKMLHSDRKAMGESGYCFLTENYLVEHTYHAIIKHLQ